jgi:hypothetical protein
MIRTSFVPKEHIDACWGQIEEYLKGAADYTHGRYEVNDIYWAIVDYDHHLWIAFDDEQIKGAVVTNIVNYPRKRYLCMSFCGGVELEKWKDPMLKMLQHWAFDNHCDGIEATARPGWAKIFKDDGHVPLWRTFELPTGNKGLKDG